MQPLRVCLAWIAGNVLVHTLPALPGVSISFALLVAGVGAVVRLRSWWPLGFAFGFAWTVHAAQDALEARLPEEFDRREVRLSGWIDDFPEFTENRVQLSVSIDAADLPLLIGRRVRLSWYEPAFDLQPGQRISLTARLRTPHGFVNPSGFDYERWLLLERYSATGYVRVLHGHGERRRGFAPWLLARRAQLRERIAAQLGPAPAAGLVTALAIGERSGFDDRHWEIFRRTGTSHLVAISGLHVGIVALTVLWCARCALRRCGGWFVERSSATAGFTALSAAVLYAALAGFALSTVRAVVMLAAALLIASMQREISRFHGLALTALLLLVIDPLETLGSSFWLSFGAVGTLFVAMAPRNPVPYASRLKRSLQGVTSVQLAIALMAVPAGAAFFQEFSLIAFAVNLLAIPFFSLILVPSALLCTLFELWPGTPAWAWQAVGRLAENAMSALESAAAVPGASVAVPAPGTTAILLAVAGVVSMLPWNPQRGRLLGLLALAPLIWPRQHSLPADSFSLSLLDVGHGLAAIVRTRNYVLIYDAGARFGSGFDSGRDVVVPALRGGRPPQTLVVSHGDNDHSGGAAAVIAAYPDIEVLKGPEVNTLPGRRCVAGQRWSRDGVEFTVLHPPAGSSLRGNDGSCVLRVSAAGSSALLTGDIERAGEAAVVAGGSVDVDIVVAPHHGSATSSTPAFVAATSPSVVVFSAGFHNRWNFPRAAVVARWCGAGADIYVTGEHGAIEVNAGHGLEQVTALRRRAPRYWRTNRERRCGESPGVTL
ncbi:MAG: DNA internalization-related competence protein ComEC/Rec2 [Gammaproteobacteria bacterium]